MWDAIISFLSTGDVELIKPYLSAAIQSRVSQELFVWGIIYLVVKRDLKKEKDALAKAKEEFSKGFTLVIDGLKNEIKEVTKSVTKLGVTLEKVEEDHLTRFGELTKRVDGQDSKNKEFESYPELFQNMVQSMIDRLKQLEEKLGI